MRTCRDHTPGCSWFRRRRKWLQSTSIRYTRSARKRCQNVLSGIIFRRRKPLLVREQYKRFLGIRFLWTPTRATKFWVFYLTPPSYSPQFARSAFKERTWLLL